jgi:hypothetical protein
MKPAVESMSVNIIAPISYSEQSETSRCFITITHQHCFRRLHWEEQRKTNGIRNESDTTASDQKS